MRRQSTGRNARRHFMLSGFSTDQKFQLCIKIKNLGGIYNETDHFEADSTHIVCKRPSRSEKFLGGCASGKWLLVPEYIEESSRHGRWLLETEYEWSTKWRHCVDPASRQFLQAPRKWREKKSNTTKGAFAGWRAAVLVDNATKQMVYKKLLVLGSGVIESSGTRRNGSQSLSQSILDQAEYLTHVFADETQAKLVQPLLDMGVFCLKPVYIGDFLLLENPPDPHSYLLDKLKSSNQSQQSAAGSRPSRRSLQTSHSLTSSSQESSKQKGRRSLQVNGGQDTPDLSSKRTTLSLRRESSKPEVKTPSDIFRNNGKVLADFKFCEVPETKPLNKLLNFANTSVNMDCAGESDCQIISVDNTCDKKLEFNGSKQTKGRNNCDLSSSDTKNNSPFVSAKAHTPAKSKPCPKNSRKRCRDAGQSDICIVYETPSKKKGLAITPRKSRSKASKDSPSLQRLNQSSIMSFVQVPAKSQRTSKDITPKLTVVSKSKKIVNNVLDKHLDTEGKNLVDRNAGLLTPRKSKMQLIFKSSVTLTDIRNSPAISADVRYVSSDHCYQNIVKWRSSQENEKCTAVNNLKSKERNTLSTNCNANAPIPKKVGMSVTGNDSSRSNESTNDDFGNSSHKTTLRSMKKEVNNPRIISSQNKVGTVVEENNSYIESVTDCNDTHNSVKSRQVRKRNVASNLSAKSTGNNDVITVLGVENISQTKRPVTRRSLSRRGSTSSTSSWKSVEKENQNRRSSVRIKGNTDCDRKSTGEVQAKLHVSQQNIMIIRDAPLSIGKDKVVTSRLGAGQDKKTGSEKAFNTSKINSGKHVELTVDEVKKNISSLMKTPVKNKEMSPLKLSEKEKLKYAMVLVRKEKKTRSENLLNADEYESKGYPMSENYAAIYETCVDELLLKEALNVISSSLSSTRYPQPKTLYSVLTDILQVTENECFAKKAYSILQQVLMLHPPSNALMQEVYLKALRDPKLTEDVAMGNEWNLVHDIISGCILDAQTETFSNKLLMLKFLVDLWEVDFQYFAQRQSCNKLKNTGQKSCLLARIIWPTGALAIGRINTACQQLVAEFMEAINIQNDVKKLEMVNLLQKMICITAQSCHYSAGTKSWGPGHLPSERVTLFAREIALKMRGMIEDSTNVELMLTTMKPPWLLLLVCEQLLEFYDESLLPLLGEYHEKCLTLKKIVAKYFYLLPPLTSGSIVTPHKKKRLEKEAVNRADSQASQNNDKGNLRSEPLKVLADSNQAKDFKGKKLNGPSPSKSETALKRRMTVVNKRNAKGETALHKACIANNIPKIKDLLQTPGIDVNAKDYAGWTSLHEACNYGHKEAVLELLQYRPAKTITSFFNKDTIDNRKLDLLACNDEGVTPLHDAVENNHIHIVGLLLQHGGRKLLEATTHSGLTPQQLSSSMEILQLLKNPPMETLVTPSKRKYVQALSQEFFSSQGSQTLSQTLLCNAATYQPAREMYTEILDGCQAKQYVLGNELKKYASLVYYLLKAYVEVYDLFKVCDYCKQHNDGTVDLTSFIVESDDNVASGSSQESSNSTCNDHDDTPKSITCESAETNENVQVKKSQRIRARMGRKAIAKVPQKSGCFSVPSADVIPSDLEILQDDMDVFSDLKYHVRAFQSHLTLLCCNAPEESVDLRVKMYVLVMRALHVQ